MAEKSCNKQNMQENHSIKGTLVNIEGKTRYIIPSLNDKLDIQAMFVLLVDSRYYKRKLINKKNQKTQNNKNA